MARENVEVVHLVLDAWNRRDLDSMLALSDPAIEYVNAPAAVEPGTRRGHQGLVTVLRTQWEALADVRQEIARVHVRGDEVITVGRVSRGMPGSDARIENRIVLSWTLRNGKVARLEVLGGGSEYQSALEAAGLAE